MKNRSAEISCQFPEILANVDLLSHEEEIELAGIIRAGRKAQERLATGAAQGSRRREWEQQIVLAKAARDELVLRNQGLVGKVARRYFDTGLTFEDLMQEGQIGLIKAGERYDPARGTRFSTYAVWWIRQAIGRAVANTGRTIRLPVNLGHKVMQLRRAENALTQQFGREATSNELAEKLEWTTDEVDTVSKSTIPIVRLEKLVGPGNEADTEIQDLMPDESVQHPEDEAEQRMLASEVAQALLDELTPWEASVLRMRYGFSDGRPHPLSDLARRYGLSREGMRQAAKRALAKVRRSHYGDSLRSYLD